MVIKQYYIYNFESENNIFNPKSSYVVVLLVLTRRKCSGGTYFVKIPEAIAQKPIAPIELKLAQ